MLSGMDVTHGVQHHIRDNGTTPDDPLVDGSASHAAILPRPESLPSPRPSPKGEGDDGTTEMKRPTDFGGPFSFSGVPTGIRTPVIAVKGRCPRPLDDGDKQIGS